MNIPRAPRGTPGSRGLVLTPAGMPWAREGRPPLVRVTGGEDAAHAATAPCLTCGEPAPVVPYAYATQDPYGACPVQEAEACVLRARAKAQAARETTARKRPVRPSRARKTLLGQGRPGGTEGGAA